MPLLATPKAESSVKDEPIAEMAETGQRATKADNLRKGPKSHDTTSGKTLAELGINGKQSAGATIPQRP